MKVVSRHLRLKNAYKARGEHVLYLFVNYDLGFGYTRANVVIERRGLTWAVVERD